MSEEICQECGGTGIIHYRMPHYEYITHDMAIDACDASLEGQRVQWGEDVVEEPCPICMKNTSEEVNV